jgi:hypothetical protein
MGRQTRERTVRMSRLLGLTTDVTVQGSGFAVTWKRFPASAPKVERALARLAGQGPELLCKGPELLCTTTEQAVRGCGRLCPSSEFPLREPRLLVTAPDFPLTDSEIMGKGSEHAVHSRDSVRKGAAWGDETLLPHGGVSQERDAREVGAGGGVTKRTN